MPVKLIISAHYLTTVIIRQQAKISSITFHYIIINIQNYIILSYVNNEQGWESVSQQATIQTDKCSDCSFNNWNKWITMAI